MPKSSKSKAAKAAEVAGDALTKDRPPQPWFVPSPHHDDGTREEIYTPAPKHPPEDFIVGPDSPRRCGAKLSGSATRGTGRTCMRRPLIDATRCRMHGGLNHGKPNLARVTHGKATKYVAIEQVKKAFVTAEELMTHEGRRKAAAMSSAIVQAKAEQIPEGVEFIPVALNAQSVFQKGIALGHELDKKDTPAAAAPVFQISNFGDSNNGVVLARTAEGAVTVQFVNGKPYILEDGTGILYPAVSTKDVDTGAEIYSRLILTPHIP